MKPRLSGLLFAIFGAIGTALMIWLSPNRKLFHGVAWFGPGVLVFGLGQMIFGSAFYREGRKGASLLGWLFLLTGAVVSVWFNKGLGRGDFQFTAFQQPAPAVQMTPITPATPAPKSDPSAMTEAELNLEAQKIAAWAVTLEKKRVALKDGDSEALGKFNAEAAEYNQRNQAIKEQLGKFRNPSKAP